MNKPNEQKYNDMIAKLDAHALLHGVDYITDICIDCENAYYAAADNIEFHDKLNADDAVVWEAMIAVAWSAAIFRLEDAGVPLLDGM